MGSLGRRVVHLGEAAAPSGRVLRLQLRVSIDVLVTLVLTVLALASSVAYQVVVRRSRRRSPGT